MEQLVEEEPSRQAGAVVRLFSDARDVGGGLAPSKGFRYGEPFLDGGTPAKNEHRP